MPNVCPRTTFAPRAFAGWRAVTVLKHRSSRPMLWTCQEVHHRRWWSAPCSSRLCRTRSRVPVVTALRMTTPRLLVLSALLEDPGSERYGLDLAAEAGIEPGTIYPILVAFE